MNEGRLEHVGVTVPDLDAAVRWYTDWFGAEELRRFERADFEIRAATLRVGEGHLEIIQPLRSAPAPSPGTWPAEFFRTVGVHHLALAVPDVVDFHRRMKAEAVEVLTGLIDGRLFFCLDPFGTRIEVRQKK